MTRNTSFISTTYTFAVWCGTTSLTIFIFFKDTHSTQVIIIDSILSLSFFFSFYILLDVFLISSSFYWCSSFFFFIVININTTVLFAFTGDNYNNYVLTFIFIVIFDLKRFIRAIKFEIFMTIITKPTHMRSVSQVSLPNVGSLNGQFGCRKVLFMHKNFWYCCCY